MITHGIYRDGSVVGVESGGNSEGSVSVGCDNW